MAARALGLEEAAVDDNVEVDGVAGPVHDEFEDLLFGGAGWSVAEDRDVGVAADFGKGAYTGGVDGFFDVGWVVRLHLAEHADGFELGVGAVAVVTEFDAGTGGFSCGGDAFDVEFRVQADLDFEGFES